MTRITVCPRECPPEQYPHLNGMSQEIIAGRHDGVHQLELGLDLLLDGLEKLRVSGQTHLPHTRG